MVGLLGDENLDEEMRAPISDTWTIERSEILVGSTLQRFLRTRSRQLGVLSGVF